jgi:hypothetical protein
MVIMTSFAVFGDDLDRFIHSYPQSFFPGIITPYRVDGANARRVRGETMLIDLSNCIYIIEVNSLVCQGYRPSR